MLQLNMEWLLDTDPNNLYPFLFVLPGGGIFVIYYNQVFQTGIWQCGTDVSLQARILDEATFETTKVFDTIPGAVNGVGGRTYPMEVSVFDKFLDPLTSFSGYLGHTPTISSLY